MTEWFSLSQGFYYYRKISKLLSLVLKTVHDCRIINKDYGIAHGTLLSVCGRLDARGVWRRMDTCICMAGLPRWHSDKESAWFKCILFNGWIIHCVYAPQFSYPFICWWTSRLLPCPGYYKQCCDEHWGTHVSFNSGFPHVYAQQWECWVIRQFYFQFFKESPHCSP